MRVLATLTLGSLMSGCSFLDQLSLNGGPQLDPNKVYLGTSTVDGLGSKEMDRYGCVSGPMLCEQRGIGFDCRCP